MVDNKGGQDRKSKPLPVPTPIPNLYAEYTVTIPNNQCMY